MSERKNFITINESFECNNCGALNPAAEKTCRNHCRNCLFSLHVDREIPGDRDSHCLGLMEPQAINKDGKKGYQMLHVCLICNKKIWNKSASDDSTDALVNIMHKQNNGLYG